MTKFANNEEFFEALKERKSEALQQAQLIGKKGLTYRNYSQIIAQVGEVYASEKGFMMYDYDTHSVSRSLRLVKKCINVMQAGTDDVNTPKITADVMFMLDDDENLIPQNPAPEGVRHFLNGAFNLKDKTFLEDPGWTKFNVVPYNLKSLNEVDPFSLAVTKKILNDWSDGKEEKIKQIKEIIFSVIEGRSRNKLVLLIAPGGNGKSIFLDICSAFAGNKGSVFCNLHEINDDNKLNDISDSSNVIIGDDLATNTKLSNDKLSRFKQLISGTPMSLNVKYEKDIIIRNKAPFIQATNSDVNFYENNASILRRLYVLNWTRKLFDINEKTFVKYENNEGITVEEEYDLGNLVDSRNELFFEAFLSYIVQTTDYFNEYFITEESNLLASNMVSDSDQVELFFNYLVEHNLLFNTYVPTALIYQKYKDYIKEENPGSAPLLANKFHKRFRPLMEKNGFIKVEKNKRHKSYTIYEFNTFSLMENRDFNKDVHFLSKSETFKKYDKNENSHYFFNENNLFDDKLIFELKNNIRTKNIPKEISDDKEIYFYTLALYDLIINQNNTYLAAKVLENKNISEIEDLLTLPISELKNMLNNL